MPRKERTGRRSKAWWAALSPEERSELSILEKADYHSGSGWNLPDGYSECGMCSHPSSGGLCALCYNRLTELLRKADQAIGLGDVGG